MKSFITSGPGRCRLINFARLHTLINASLNGTLSGSGYYYELKDLKENKIKSAQ